MASNVSHQLTVAIGAALSGSFSSVTADATSKISKIGTAIKDMEKQGTLGTRSLDNLKLRYNSFLGSMNKQQQIIQKRAFYRSQIIDVVALGATLAAPINSAMKFESAMADVKKVVDFSASDGLQKMGDSLKELSRTIPLSVEGLAQITAAGGQLGVGEKDLIPFTTNVAKMSTAFDMLPDEAGKSMATLSNVFNIPITALTQLGDAINHISNNSAASARNIVPALARMGGAARQFGLSAEKASALVGTLIAMGKAPEEAGTAAAAILQRLQLADKLGPRAEKAFRKMGMSAKTFSKMIAKDAQGALLTFFDSLSKVAGQDRASVLIDIFGKNYSSTVATLVGSLDKYKQQLQLISDPKNYSGSMEKEFLARSATTENSIQILKNAFSELSITLGNSLLPTVNNLAQSIGAVMQSVTGWIAKNPELTSTITHLVGGLIGLKVATFALSYASTFLFGGLNRLVIVFKGLRLGMALAGAAFRSFFKVSPLAFVGIAWAVYENWERVRAFFVGIWDTVEPHWLRFKAVLDEYGITDKIMSAWTTVRDFFSNIWSVAEPHWNTFIEKIQSLNIADKIMASWTKLKTFFTGIWDNIAPKWDAFTAPLSKIWDGAKSSVSSVGSLFSANENRPSIASKLPPLNSTKAVPVTKNQSVTNNITVNASKISDPREVAKQVSKEMKSFNWGFLYDHVGDLP